QGSRCCFFFQAEDGIRDGHVTGVQTCALPISAPSLAGTDTANPIGSILSATMMLRDAFGLTLEADWVEQSLTRVLSGGYRTPDKIGRASCRERVCLPQCDVRMIGRRRRR